MPGTLSEEIENLVKNLPKPFCISLNLAIIARLAAYKLNLEAYSETFLESVWTAHGQTLLSLISLYQLAYPMNLSILHLYQIHKVKLYKSSYINL